jgi:Zn-dependent protease with chaperone function
MRGLADAALLGAVAAGSVATMPAMVRATWPRRSPATAILLWQALGLAGGLAAVGTLLGGVMIGLPVSGHPTSIAGAFLRARALETAWWHEPGVLIAARGVCLVAGLALLTLLCWVLVAATAGVVNARRRQRELLALLAHGDPKVPGALVLDHPAAAAYCVPGLHSTIVFSAGALELLDPAELAAVLAHERAHLRERHDLVLLPFTALRRAFPRSGLCADAYRAVALLVEMLADDRALRARPARELISALVLFGTAGQVPAGTLAAGGEGDVAARVARLLRPMRPLPAPAIAAICAGAAVIAAAPAVLLVWVWLRATLVTRYQGPYGPMCCLLLPVLRKPFTFGRTSVR